MTIRSLSVHEVEEAPEGPGLYAWYGSLVVGRADWEEAIRDGQDVGDRSSRVVLRGHAERHGSAALTVSAKAGFDLEYSGVLTPRDNSDVASMLAGEAGRDSTLFERVVSSVSMRRTLMNVLASSAPVFAAPLYIGVSQNLRVRLRRHVEQLTRYWAGVSKDPEYLEALVRETGTRSTFAFRAVERGFSVDNVRVWYTEIESAEGGDSLSADEQRSVAEAAEWFLNRCHRPLLGRK